MFQEVIFFMPENPALSLVVWIMALVAALYFAREHAHQALLAFGRVFSNAMRMTAHSLMLAEARVKARNREVMLASGAEQLERQIEREFDRVGRVVERDLQGYPALHRNLSDLVTRMEEDYRQSTDTPPEVAGWTEAIEAVARIPSTGDTVVGKILADIGKSMDGHHKQSLEEYRKSSAARHSMLGRMMPAWRKVQSTMGGLHKTVSSLMERAGAIDRHIKDYEEVRTGTDRAERMLLSSATSQFMISALVLVVALGGAFINFNLIALPMSEMVGGGNYIGPFRTADVAALVIIFVEATIGLFLMESLRITRLFPMIGALDDKLRLRMLWVLFVILLTLAGVESALAFMRDRIAADMEMLRQTLAGAGGAAGGNDPSMIPMVGQMVLGFILPFALTFIAIPLESFIHSGRVVLGSGFAVFLRALAFLARLIGLVVRSLCGFLIRLYDVAAFIPLAIERAVHNRGALRKPNPLKTGQGVTP